MRDQNLDPSLPLTERRHPVSIGLYALMSGSVCGVLIATFSGDWACSAIGLGLVAGLVTGGVVRLLRYLQLDEGKWRLLPPVLILVMAVSLSAWLRWDLRHRAFREAFGVDVPSEIQDLMVKRYYGGGPGDSVTLIRFRASPEEMSALTATRQSSDEDGYLAEFAAGRMSSAELWGRVFGLADSFDGYWNSNQSALKDPVLFQKRVNEIHTTILWDRGTGIVYVMHSIG